MAERIELSEAIRSILDEDKEGNDKQEDVASSSKLNRLSSSSSILGNTTWDPRYAPGRNDIFDKKMKRSNASEPNFKSPKKRRHINEVIILRNSRRKSKPSPGANSFESLKQKLDKQTHSGSSKRKEKDLWDLQDLQSYDETGQPHRSQESSLSARHRHDRDLVDSKQTHDSNASGNIIGGSEESAKQLKLFARKKHSDDSLTNITWLHRMCAPDVDPQALETSKVSDPRLEKPPYSYSTLIQFAFSTAPSGHMTLREIYHWIELHFPYFRTAKLGWRNSIRHNLSLHKIFIREPPASHGQPAFWTLQPGTVVRLPEKTMFVAKKKSGNPSSNTSGGSHRSHKTKLSNKRLSTEHGGKEEKKKKEQYILPRPTQQPVALVPVPIFLSTDAGTQMVTSSATGEPILSPSPINLLPEAQLRNMFAPRKDAPGQRKNVKIALKITTSSEAAMTQEAPRNSSMNLKSSFPNATFSTSSGFRDSGIGTDGEGTFHESLLAAGPSDILGSSPPECRHLPIKKRGSSWNRVTSSTPYQNSKLSEKLRPLNEGTDLSVFDDLSSFDCTPTKTPNRRSKRKLTTPSRSFAPCPDWLSPIRELTPFKFGDEFTNLKDDLDVTPPRTGLTPKNKLGQMAASSLSTPKSHRSPALGSLGDVGLSGLTPERISDIQNQSFSKVFGSDLSFEMDSDGFWSMMP